MSLQEAAWAVGSTILIGAGTYAATGLLGYVVHWAIHQKWAGKAYRSHRAHHIDLYPPGRLVSDEYRDAGSKSTVWTFLLAFSPLMLLPIIFWATGVIAWFQAAAALTAMIVVGLINDVVHDSFHVVRHPLARFIPRFAALRSRHFVHHHNMKRNFGIFSFTWDRLFGTFKDAP